MATTHTTVRPKKSQGQLQKYGQNLNREISERAEKLADGDRKLRHKKLLEIANRSRG